jgi:tetratricopeptide (TPR) repeat protein
VADDYYLLGLKEENFDNREQAKEAYKKALQLDDTHQDAHFHYGLMLLRSAQLNEADMHLSRAEELGKVESTYYRGLIAMLESRLVDAEEYFKKENLSESLAAASLIGLGKVALKKNKWDQAIEFFSLASLQASHSVTPLTLLAIAHRYSGNTEESHSILQQVLERDPINHMALYEMTKGNYPESEVIKRKLDRLLTDDDQYFMDLACHYIDAGLARDALEVLSIAWSMNENAMKAYLSAFICGQLGDINGRDAWFDKARNSSAEFGFPSRQVEVLALRFACDKDNNDAKARYFLGNFYYAHERFTDAMQLWTEALEGMGAYDVLFRNLGIAAWQRLNDPSKAIEWFEKALVANPHNQDIYLYLDELYKSQNRIVSREGLLKRINSLADVREDVHKHRITMMVELGHYQEAIELMTSEKFIPLEMDQSFHEVYVKALMMRAKVKIDAGRFADAILDYTKMLEYPENQGVGAPTTRAQAHIYYNLGITYEKMGKYQMAIKAWLEAASEHHPNGNELFKYTQMALDKLSRYSELGLEE